LGDGNEKARPVKPLEREKINKIMLQYSNSSSVMEQNPSKSNRFLYREKTRHSITILRYFGFKTLLTATFALFMAMIMTAQNPDVYVAGSVANAKGNRVATVWKNGEVLYQLTDGEYDALTYSIYVSGNDVYVAGTEDNATGAGEGRLWKNGQKLYSFTSGTQNVSAYSVCVSSNDVYAAGEMRTSGATYGIGKVWKNGTELYSNNNVRVSKMCISNGDIYVCGYQGSNAKVWKNGVEYWTTDVTNYSATAHSIYASNGNIYVSMNWTSSSSAIIAKINQGTSFTNMREFGTYTSVSVGSFAVSGSDIYAAVNSRNNTIWMTYLYKNSSILKNYLSVGGGTMYLFGNDVYFAFKNNGNQIKVCKNDTELYILHEGVSLDNVSSIFVIEHSNADMNNIQVNDILFYPNPVKDNLFIQIKTNIDKVEIYDFLGKQVLSKNINGEKEINIRDLPKGIYFVNVLSKDKVIGNSKIVKQ
jgi:hypothetical protein